MDEADASISGGALLFGNPLRFERQDGGMLKRYHRREALLLEIDEPFAIRIRPEDEFGAPVGNPQRAAAAAGHAAEHDRIHPRPETYGGRKGDGECNAESGAASSATLDTSEQPPRDQRRQRNVSGDDPDHQAILVLQRPASSVNRLDEDSNGANQHKRAGCKSDHQPDVAVSPNRTDTFAH
jgi:hypothetical protein